MFVQVDQRFGVADGFELVPVAHQVGAKFLIIVDFSVEHDPQGAVLIGNGLMAGVEIDNAQTAHPDTAAAIDMVALVIRTAMPDLIAHGSQSSQLRGLVTKQDSGDPTHTASSLSQTSGYNISYVVNRASKRAAEALFHRAGGTWWIRNHFRHSVRILMYHRFPAQSRFEQQCAHLSRYYRPISLGEAANRIREEKAILDGAVVVTIDDGYRDFLERAFPALQRHRIPATVFLTTDLPDRQSWLWVDQVSYCVRHAQVKEIALDIAMPERFYLDTEEQRGRAAFSIKEALKKIPNERRLEWMRILPRLLNVDLPQHPPESHTPLAWDDVRFLAKEGIEFGAHTRTHPILSRVSGAGELQGEIHGSKARIESETGKEVLHFCYPNGNRTDFTQPVVEAVKSAGFKSAVTALQGVNRRGANAFELLRISVSPDQDELSFGRVVAGYRILRMQQNSDSFCS